MSIGSRISFPPKLQGETITLPFDFASKLAAGETISAQVVTASVYSGVDASPSSIISSTASVTLTSIVTQKIIAGVAGVLYYLLATVTTSTGQTLQLGGYLAVLAGTSPP